jgi:hypothetical protein
MMATKQEIRDYFAKFGKEGGKATARNRTAEQRSEAARKAVQARWAKKLDDLQKNLARTNTQLKTLEQNNRRRKQKKEKTPK